MEESMDVFCESVGGMVTEEQEVVSEDVVISPQDDTELNVSFETAITSGDMEITQNDDSEGDSIDNLNAESSDYQIYGNADQTGIGMYDIPQEIDPTETLEKVLRDSQSSNLSAKQVKQEPDEDEAETEHGKSQDVSSHDDAPPAKRVKKQKKPGKPPKPVKTSGKIELEKSLRSKEKPGPASSKSPLHITRSGRKSTFTGMQQQKKTRPGPKKKDNKARESSKINEKSDKEEEQSECLVCHAPCTVTVNRAIPCYPFCQKCKKAYFKQKTSSNVIQPIKQKCPKGGVCNTDYRFPKKWCSICHLHKFNNILRKLKVEFDLDSEELRKCSGSRRNKSEDAGDANLHNSSSVLLQRMSSRELADYGIEVVHSIKDEPLDFDGYSGQSQRNSPNKRLMKDDNHKAKKQSMETKSTPDMTKSRTKKRSIAPNQNQNSSGTDTGDESTEKFVSGSGGKKASKPPRKRKVLMEYIPSSSDEDESYSLPAVTIGHKAVTSQDLSSATKSYKNQSGTATNQGEIRSEPTDTEDTSNYTEVLESIKVYVFTCGHACGLCNTEASKEWLKESGFYTAKPLVRPSSVKKSNPVSSTTSANPKPTTPFMNNSTPKGIPPSGSNKTQQILSLPVNVLQNLLRSAKSSGGAVQIQLSIPPNQSNSTTTTAAQGQKQPSVPDLSANKNSSTIPQNVSDNVKIIQQPSTSTTLPTSQTSVTMTSTILSSTPLDQSVKTVTKEVVSGNKVPVVWNNILEKVLTTNQTAPLIQTVTPETVPATNLTVPVFQNVTPTTVTTGNLLSQSEQVQFAPTPIEQMLEFQNQYNVLNSISSTQSMVVDPIGSDATRTLVRSPNGQTYSVLVDNGLPPVSSNGS